MKAYELAREASGYALFLNSLIFLPEGYLCVHISRWIYESYARVHRG